MKNYALHAVKHLMNHIQVYYDGHEREDVVQYRKEWTKRMLAYSEKMRRYEGDNMEQEILLSLRDGEQELVLVTHDESTFYANDGVARAWLSEGETMLQKKSMGGSIMVSEFMCPCHGRLKIDESHPNFRKPLYKEARVMIYHGTNRDG